VASLLCTVLIVVLAGTAVFQAVTYLLWLYEKRRGGAFSATDDPLRLWTAGLSEWFAFLVVVLGWPMGVFGKPKPRPGGDLRPVVLIHGWSLNRASMAMLAARLRKDGRDVYAINYPSMLSDTDAKSEAVAKTLLEIAAAYGGRHVDVVAHSLGGVVTRAAARFHGADQVLGNVVTLGSPHCGTALAILVRSFGLVQLRPESRFLSRLLEAEEENDPAKEPFSLTSIASSFDAVVFPHDLSFPPGAFCVTLEGYGHHGLLFAQRVYQLVKENLDAPEAAERHKPEGEQSASVD
jgi:pimeloyl-ACP methyl ester carboxylesterase